MTKHLNVRISDGELEALDRASAEMGCSRSQVERLLIHCLAEGGARMGAGTVAFDYETSHGIVRNLRSIVTLYNQSVAALNTIAKVARESPDEVAAEDALGVLRVVNAEMTYVADLLGCLREDVAMLSDRPSSSGADRRAGDQGHIGAHGAVGPVNIMDRAHRAPVAAFLADQHLSHPAYHESPSSYMALASDSTSLARPSASVSLPFSARMLSSL